MAEKLLAVHDRDKQWLVSRKLRTARRGIAPRIIWATRL
jgi:hypothetical protein